MHLSTKVLLISVGLSIPVLLTGLGVGLGVFFGIQSDETSSANETFVTSIEGKVFSIQSTVNATIRAVHTISSLFKVSDVLTPYEEFIPFMEKSQSKILGTHSLGWISHVQHASRDSFVSQMRTYGQDYEHFNINARNMGGQLIPAPDAPSYYPVSYIHPLESNLGALGFNIYAEPIRKDAVVRSVDTGDDAVTSRIYLPHTKYQQPGVLYLSPARNGSEIVGFGVGVFIIGDMFHHSVADLLETSLVTVFDMGDAVEPGLDAVPLTLQEWDERNYTSESFLWSNQGTYGPDFGTEEEIQVMKGVAKGSPFHYRYSIPVGDRVWDIVFVPRTIMSTANKWVALVFSIAAGIVVTAIICTISIFLYVRWRSEMKVHNLEKGLLEEDNKRNQEYLERMATAEENKKRILDNVPDLIVVVNRTGKIIYANSIFTDTLGYKMSDFSGGVYIKDIFVELPEDFYSFEVHSEFKETNIIPRLGSSIAVSFSTSVIDIDERSFSGDSPSRDRSSGDTNKAFLLIIRDLRENKALLKEIQNTHDRMHQLINDSEFERRWTDEKEPAFRKDMLRFCRKNKNEENILFLTDVEKYKKLKNFNERIHEQDRIMSTYILPSGDRQLNLKSSLLREMEETVRTEMGRTGIFDKVLMFIKITVATDIYPRYAAEERKRVSTVSTSSASSN